MYQFDNLTNCAAKRSSAPKSPKPVFRTAGDHSHKANNIRRVVLSGDNDRIINHDGTKGEYREFLAESRFNFYFVATMPIPDQTAIRAAWAELTTPEKAETIVSVENW